MPLDTTRNAYTPSAAITTLTGAFGTSGTAIVDVTGAFSQSILNDNFRRLQDRVNAITAALRLSGVISN
jgi:hypothetical protein